MKKIAISTSLIFTSLLLANNYNIVDTGQNEFFDNDSTIFKPSKDDDYYGQDASYLGNQFSYTDNEDGTIFDNTTKLMWSKSITRKLILDEALSYIKVARHGGFSDWRIPNIKELYSLINFQGRTGLAKPSSIRVPSDARPYINTRYFDFEYPNSGRYIDAQYWTSTDNVSYVMHGKESFFGVNFADGRIKGYPKYKAKSGQAKFYLRLVRGNEDYGKNHFVDNQNGTISDYATNLKWTKEDSKKGMNWKEALNYCESLSLAGESNWRLPNAKELQSIVDYTKSPDTTNSASIDSIFNTTSILNEAKEKDFPFYWTSTTHLDGRNIGEYAVYISFGRALGYMQTPRSFSKELMDVHGAGAQRSDPKSGNASNFSQGHGPQGDVVRIKNFVRCVSDDLNNKNKKIVPLLKKEKVEKKEFRKKNSQEHPALKDFDKNNDSKISYEEAPKMMKRNFKKHDLNNDGYIFAEELKTLPKKPRR